MGVLSKQRQASPAITPRDRRFARAEPLPRWWWGGDPYGTAALNSLSVTFPQTEAFFVESVRKFRHAMAPDLDAAVSGFVAQEMNHSREHRAFNRQVAGLGYDIKRLTVRVGERLAKVSEKRSIDKLATTVALEHITAIFARRLLAEPHLLAGADQDAADLWRWHAVEEIEHKAVAYDTWLHVTQNWSGLRRWLHRTRVMLRVTRHFARDRRDGALDLLAQDGIKGMRARFGLFRVLFLNPGLARSMVGPWAAFFKPGFHPWKLDDRALIAVEA